MANKIKLIVGLGNPGPDYQATRHNAGVWCLAAFARQHGAELRAENKFKGLAGRVQEDGLDVRLLFPTTYMNKSGEAIKAIAQFYKIEANEILVLHDELDLPVGSCRFKEGGGHGGHNGLRDTIKHLGTNKFHRLRIGIGHPGEAKEVINFVLRAPSKKEIPLIERSLDDALACFPEYLAGHTGKAMQALHTQKD